MRALVIALGSALVVAACSGDPASPASAGAGLRVVNASGSPVDLFVDDHLWMQGLPIAGVTAPLAVAPGSHTLRLRSASDATAGVTLSTTAGKTVTAYASGSATLHADVLEDTGAVVPTGKSKLRVVHLAESAPAVEIWRTQPDYHTPIHVVTPFEYPFVSAYLQSDAGSWEVWLTAPGSTTKLVSTGAIAIPSGERRTVVFVDSAGVMRLRVLEN